MNNHKNILIFDRYDSIQRPGGDTVQIKEIRKFLEINGHDVTISRDLKLDLSKFDTILIFNLTLPFEAFLQAKVAVSWNKPYILFPVYWDLDSLEMGEGVRGKELLKRSLPHVVLSWIRAFNFWRAKKLLLQHMGLSLIKILDRTKLIRFTLQHATAICPNSIVEMEHLIETFRIQEIRPKIQVIYNGVPLSLQKTGSKIHHLDKCLPQEYICCVGGIGPRKNQLQLVKAANRLKVPLVIVGQAAKGCDSYVNRIKTIAEEHIIFLNHLSQEEVYYVMSKSRGHIQPSYIETPGLASLEAAVLGCPVGVSDVGPVREYFQDYAYYCNPYDTESISRCLQQLWEEKKYSLKLSEFILEKYNWSKVLQPLNVMLQNHDIIK